MLFDTALVLTFCYSVPKFFRWLSERYPAISQVIAENRIPEFDCLYVRLPQSRCRTTVADTLQ